MIPKIDYFISCLDYTIQTRIFRKKIPFIAGLVLNQECNLACKHCKVSNTGDSHLTYSEVQEGLMTLRKEGIRSIAITGGEPLLWQDEAQTFDDVIRLTREVGFKVCSVYTNGTLPLNLSCDVVFVSMDGTKETTRKLRGDIYDTVIENITRSTHPNIIANYTINALNCHEIEAFCAAISKIPNIRGTYFYFHTPYYGIDELFLDIEAKRKIIETLMRLKKKYPIFNSTSCLVDAHQNRWERPSEVCYVYSNTGKLFRCCREIGNTTACENCGYLGYVEVQNILKFKPSAIISAFRYLPSSKARNSVV